jgi:hypothetical protein
MTLAKAASYIIVIALFGFASNPVNAEQSKLEKVSSKTVDLMLNDVSIKQAIDKLFGLSNFKYFINPGVSGRVVEMKLKGVTFEQGLDALMEAGRLNYTIENGVYVISPSQTPTATSALYSKAPAVEQPVRSQPASQIREQPETPPAGKQDGENQSAEQPLGGPSQVIINEQKAPMIYSMPQPAYPPYGYGGYGNGGGGYGGGYYRFGNVGIIGGWGGAANIGGSPYIIGRGPMPPPPPGWVGPDLDRFLRTQWAIQNRTYIQWY